MAEKNVASELEKIRLEKESLELEDLRFKVTQQRERQLANKQRGENQEQQLRDQKEQEKRNHIDCNHRKGGNGLEGLKGNGDDTKYAIIIHTYPDTNRVVMCQRCNCEWWPGEEKHHTGVPYSVAVRWPTDNQPSGASLFSIQRSA